MQPFACAVLKLLCLFVFMMMIWIVMKMLASIHAHPHLPAYLVHLFARPQPFRFMDLPPELRNMVYAHLSDRYWITWTRVIRRQRGAVLADAFLYLNKQVHREAMHVLVPRANGELRIKVCAMQNEDAHSQESILRITDSFHKAMQKRWAILLHVRTIHLDICWLDYDWLDWSGWGSGGSLGVDMLKLDIEMVCVLWLAKMPNLRTIKIGLLGGQTDANGWVPFFPARDRIPGLLRPLKVVRRRNPGVVVEMPEGCPISTAELAELQQGRMTSDGGSVL